MSACSPSDGSADAGNGPAMHADAGLRKLAFVRFSQEGSYCFEDCTTARGVEAPSTLILEDIEGELRFEIEPYEFEEVERLVQSPGFATTVADSLAGRDCGGFDIGLSMTYQWTGEQTNDVPHVDSCGVTEGYVLRDLSQYLNRLKEKHLKCPPWVEPPGFELATDPLPQRPICWFCYGRCLAD